MNTMQITLSSPTRLKITWPQYDAPVDAEIRQRLSAVPGIESGYGREAYAPVIQLQRLMELYPRASYDYRAMQQADCVARRFYESMVKMSVRLRINSAGDVIPFGDNISPEVERLVIERSHAIKPFVVEAMKYPVTARRVEVVVGDAYYPKRRRRGKGAK